MEKEGKNSSERLLGFIQKLKSLIDICLYGNDNWKFAEK